MGVLPNVTVRTCISDSVEADDLIVREPVSGALRRDNEDDHEDEDEDEDDARRVCYFSGTQSCHPM